jgi:hypothetical protein
MVAGTVLGRYNNVPGCATFATDLANVWNDYYKIKTLAFTPIKNALTTIETDATLLGLSLNGLQSSFVSANNTFSSISSLVDPSYGMIQGLNCKIFG